MNKGEIIQLGEHLLICGDCRDQGDVDKLLKDKKVKSVITDPPYGINYVKGKDWLGIRGVQAEHFGKFKEIKGDSLSGENYVEFTKGWIKPILEHLTSYNSFYIFNCDQEICSLKKGAEDCGIYYSQLIIWIKNTIVLGRKDFNPQHELILYGWYGRHKFYKSTAKSIIFCPKPERSKKHPTMKPVRLLRELILNSTKIGDYVYDCFGGSGSTLMACEQTKRKCLMMEIDEHYCDIIIERWENYTKKKSNKIL